MHNELPLPYLRHEALCLYSLLSGERLEEHLWVRWLTWIRKAKGTTACQETSGRVQAYGTRCWETRVIWRKLDCLNPNLQKVRSLTRRKDVRYRRRPLRPDEYGRTASSGTERCPMRTFKEMSGTPTSR